MDGFSILDTLAWRPECVKLHPAYAAGNAAAWLSKTGSAMGTNHYLSGRLYVSKSGYLLLSVPNALVRGVFDAMNAPGVELPTMSAFKGEAADGELLNAHITVMTDKEVEQIGKEKINERGHTFHYALGPVREFSPKTESLSRVWAIQVASPELATLRKSYGLTPLPNEDHQFHITVAVRRKSVMAFNEIAKIDGSRGTELKAAEVKDVLHGGQADKMPDKKFNPEALAEGVEHEHEHTDDGQIAKEIAKDHLQEDPVYYKKVEQIEKESAVLDELRKAKEHSDHKRYAHKNEILRKLMAEAPEDWVIDSQLRDMRGVTHLPTKFKLHTRPTVIPSSVKAAMGSVYGNQALNMLNFREPIAYDHNKPVFENIKNQLQKVKERGDFMLQSRRNYDLWRSQLDPQYRYQLALAHFRNQMPQPSLPDQIIERYGDGMIASLPNGWRR